eukprot:3215739-Pyramimonas_sp.AAC.1
MSGGSRAGEGREAETARRVASRPGTSRSARLRPGCAAPGKVNIVHRGAGESDGLPFIDSTWC